MDFVAEEPTGARVGILRTGCTCDEVVRLPEAEGRALWGASGVCKRTQTAGEIALDVTDFGEGLVWLFVLDLKERCGVSLSDGSGELSGRSHKV